MKKPKKQQKPAASVRRMQWIKWALITSYAVIAVGAILITSLIAIRKTDAALKNKVSSLTSSLNVQMKLNMESYLDRMEKIAALAFSDDTTFTYDATNPGVDEYEALNLEEQISDTLYSLCLMENFVDYSIVYRNNHFVGKMSNGTTALFGDRLYEDLHAMVSRQRTHDGWSAGYADNFKRIYYVKELHENAILVISFYTSELENVFDNPETMSDMTVRLTNSDYEILYSSDTGDEPGVKIPEELVSRVQGQSEATVMDDEYLVTVDRCASSWYVLCSIPTSIILSEKNEIRFYIFITALVASLLAVLLATLVSFMLSDVVVGLVSTLDVKAHIDQLTGIYNKRSFEEKAKARLMDEGLTPEMHALILLDIDNFKGVNDTLGHTYGDEVLSKVGSTLRSVFSAEDILGRVGGDEFCVFMNFKPGVKREEVIALVQEKCKAVCEAFHGYYTGDDHSYKISASMGVSISPEHGKILAELYGLADHALYHSKKKGKDTFTIYDPSLAAEEKS